MSDPGKINRSALFPILIVIFTLICLVIVLATSVVNRIIDLTIAISIFIAAGAITTSVIMISYSKKISVCSAGMLIIGMLFYANSATCYILGLLPLNYLVGVKTKCVWGLYPNHVPHGLVMLVLGVGMIIMALRSIMLSKGKSFVEKVLEYVLIGMGVIQTLAGTMALVVK